MYRLLDCGVLQSLQDHLEGNVLPHIESDRNQRYIKAATWMDWKYFKKEKGKEPSCRTEWKETLMYMLQFTNIKWRDTQEQHRHSILVEFVGVLLHEDALHQQYFPSLISLVPAANQVYNALNTLCPAIDGAQDPLFWLGLDRTNIPMVALPFSFPCEHHSQDHSTLTGFPVIIASPTPLATQPALESHDSCLAALRHAFTLFKQHRGSNELGNTRFEQLIQVNLSIFTIY